MITVTYTCTKQPDTNCPLIQLNDDGTTYRCTGCSNHQLNLSQSTPADTHYVNSRPQELTPGHLQEV
jgi:hypothetical protein